jgi:phosphoheptose isomerase
LTRFGEKEDGSGARWINAGIYGLAPEFPNALSAVTPLSLPGDIQMGRACGATTVLVRTGYGGRWELDGLKADFVADDLAAAAERIQAMLSLTTDAEARLRRHIETSIETKRKLLERGVGRMLEAAGIMRECLAGGNKLLLCGNGGSAGDAQHIAAEFVSVLNQNFLRPGLAAIALTTDTSVLTASANDFGFAGVFERQVQALGRPGDVVIGISTVGQFGECIARRHLRAIPWRAHHRADRRSRMQASGGSGSRASCALRCHAIYSRVAHHDGAHSVRPGGAIAHLPRTRPEPIDNTSSAQSSTGCRSLRFAASGSSVGTGSQDCQ